MQVWQFAAKRSHIPPQLKCALWQLQSAKNATLKDGNQPTASNEQISLIMDPELESSSKDEMDECGMK